jgi:hypothetical protein
MGSPSTIAEVRRCSRSRSSSYTWRSTRAREPATHDWPAAPKMPARRPASAASSAASAKTMFGLFPPSSSVTGARRAPALAAMRFPVDSLPVNATFATPGCSTSAAPASPAPVTTFRTPGGKPASSARRSVSTMLAAACSDGLTTIVFPAASAGAIEYIVSSTGEFQGTMIPTTPSGSRSV